MARSNILRDRVRPTKDNDEYEEIENGSETESQRDVPDRAVRRISNNGQNFAQLDQPENSSNQWSSDGLPAYPGGHEAISSISFGALASAQASLSRKRKRDSTSRLHESDQSWSRNPFFEAKEREAGKNAMKPLGSKASNDAPTEISAKKAVSRKRGVIAVPNVKHRDPRFSKQSKTVNLESVSKNYAFLNDYRASEIADVKSKLGQTKDPRLKEALRKELTSMEDRERTRLRKEEEKAVVRDHRREERAKTAKGKKPYYLKKGDVKKQVLERRFQGMGEKQVDKAIEKRRKKMAKKERARMPEKRRTVALS